MWEGILTRWFVWRRPGRRRHLGHEARADGDIERRGNGVEFVQSSCLAGRQREMHCVRRATFHAALVFITTTGTCTAAAVRRRLVGTIRTVPMVVRVNQVAVPVGVRVVVMPVAVRMQPPLNQREASQAGRTHTQPELHAIHAGRNSPRIDPAQPRGCRKRRRLAAPASPVRGRP